MSDSATDPTQVTTPAAPPAQPVLTPEQAEALRREVETQKNRASSADQARTRAEQERDAERQRIAQFEAQAAEAQARIEAAEAKAREHEERANKAEATRERDRLVSLFPDAAALYKDGPLPSEDVLRGIQERIATPTPKPEPPTARVPNPAKSTTPPAEPTLEDMRESLDAGWSMEVQRVRSGF